MAIILKKWLFLISVVLSLLTHTSTRAEKIKSESKHNILSPIPRWIHALPTVFPKQSDHLIVPPTASTEDKTWIDLKHKDTRIWLDQTAQHINDWFGEPHQEDPASASLRLLLDYRWNKHEGFELRPRLRGKIELPTLEKRLSMVFGDDSLDDQLNNQVAITNENPILDEHTNFDHNRTRHDNGSLAIRWSTFSEKIPFETDIDLGTRSLDDIYVRLKAKKDWALKDDFHLYFEQIYRYGIQSENYLRSNLELIHQHKNDAFLSNQFSLTYTDISTDDLNWNNYALRQHQFFHGSRFNYGIYTGGFYNEQDLRLNSWGPFVSWRQPLFREWLYIQGDLNYYNEHREDRSHYLSAVLRLETLF